MTFCDIFPLQGIACDSLIDLYLWKVAEAGGQREKRKVPGFPLVALSGRALELILHREKGTRGQAR